MPTRTGGPFLPLGPLGPASARSTRRDPIPRSKNAWLTTAPFPRPGVSAPRPEHTSSPGH